ncbi:hypothetical protein EV356DRAFT_370288 [Viridothelium virens]|uniref:Uncharacterized protein n=1 Tax=Viridothelium virens TaxID=1048519 RepID=A0A6A6GVE7_VIRVR|nr:hypothetical protein EV356DRAFT_370288 [Viridothelium virens]
MRLVFLSVPSLEALEDGTSHLPAPHPGMHPLSKTPHHGLAISALEYMHHLGSHDTCSGLPYAQHLCIPATGEILVSGSEGMLMYPTPPSDSRVNDSSSIEDKAVTALAIGMSSLWNSETCATSISPQSQSQRLLRSISIFHTLRDSQWQHHKSHQIHPRRTLRRVPCQCLYIRR